MLAVVATISIAVLTAGAPVQDDLAFLQPWFTADRNERDALARHQVVVRALPATERQLSVIAVCAINAAPEALIASMAGGHTPGATASGSFATPPSLADLSTLTLDQGDIDRLRVCRPGSCALNLADGEMSDLQLALRTSVATANEAYRRVLLDRLQRYLSSGRVALPEYKDRREPVQPAKVFSKIVEQVPYLKTSVPVVANYVERFPTAVPPGAESSLRWSKLTMNEKPVIMLTHRTIFRLQPSPSVPRVLAIATQIYASRYMNGELSLTMFFAGAPAAPRYLVVMSRSDLDELGGMFSGLKRTLFERRIKDEAVNALTALRNQLEKADGHLR